MTSRCNPNSVQGPMPTARRRARGRAGGGALRALASGATLALAAAGCTLTPEFNRPVAPVADTHPAQPVLQTGQAASEIAWRQFFVDPRLQTLIRTALDNNRDLRIAALRVEEARALYNVQSADLLPSINATGSAGRTRTPAGTSPLGRPLVASNYQVGVSLAAFE